MVGQFLLLSGSESAGPVVAVGAIITLAGMQSFGINLLRTIGASKFAKTPHTSEAIVRKPATRSW